MSVKFLHPKTRQGAFETAGLRHRPNIILITVDMISPDCYLPSRPLSQHIETPNILSLLQQGHRFNNAFTPSPLCGPARAAICTGMHPPYLSNGERTPSGMKSDLEPGDLIFQDYLKQQGYNLKHVGKCHVGAPKFIETFGENLHAWDRWGPPVMDDDRYIDYIGAMGVTAPRYSRELRGTLADRNTASTSFGGWIEQQNGDAFPRDAHYSVFLAELAIRQLKASQMQAPGKPVFAQIDFFDPHQPYSIPHGYAQRYDYLRSVVQVPASFHDLQNAGGTDQNPIFRLYHRYWGLYDEALVKDYIACHLLQVELVDYAIGKLFAYLREAGLWDDSLILFTADHGEMNGRLGLADKGSYFHPDIFRVPMLVKPAGNRGVAAKDIATPVSLVDLAPTILQAAGLEPAVQMEGASLLDMVPTGSRPALEQVYQLGIHVGTNFGFGCQLPLGDTHWFYGYSATTGCEELYDLGAVEPVNVINDPALTQVRARMVQHAATLMRSDKRWSGYFSSFRLHNMEHFMDESLDDIQMLKPQA
ncbi:sulfatase-like hydrolase/transferase [Marinobacterium rhizophilum]|uniref:Sulfatase-like hydrolase/transferase n=1 Tax=Marinobacterium rhizophilum TaxID=420402 RepID=A0ABY5HEJ6_9GAMM|nr:sulfatase-like hydrolase/transferase [Marinobacterium rhizophilum]UTW10705.1 sulfatase-like hydrolase/transferase [Marinobacterium rhizophilum]